MILVGANYIIKFFSKEPDEHYQKSREFIEDLARGKVKVIISEGVLMECFFVLNKFYKYSRDEVVDMLTTIMNFKNVLNEDKYIILRLPSGEMRKILSVCMATIGIVGNEDFSNMVVGKAGRQRHLGKRPQTRGSAMNPIDHPHGGGEGKTNSGRHPVTPWGMPTKGYKTRKKKASDKLIISRKKK